MLAACSIFCKQKRVLHTKRSNRECTAGSSRGTLPLKALSVPEFWPSRKRSSPQQQRIASISVRVSPIEKQPYTLIVQTRNESKRVKLCVEFSTGFSVRRQAFSNLFFVLVILLGGSEYRRLYLCCDEHDLPYGSNLYRTKCGCRGV